LLSRPEESVGSDHGMHFACRSLAGLYGRDRKCLCLPGTSGQFGRRFYGLAVCRQHSDRIRRALPLNGIPSQGNDMADHEEKACPSCGQRLRFPKNVGGIVMACPSCKQKFHSDFKIGVGQRTHSPGVAVTLFELPGRVLARIVRFFSS
jgi:hypothetical protein